MVDFPAPTTGPISTLCRCGCGEATASYRSVYRPGHDSKHISHLLIDMLNGIDQLEHGKLKQKDYQTQVSDAFILLPSAALQDRLYNAVLNYGRGRLRDRLVELGIQPFEASRASNTK
ncbi:hypothetical protein KDJ02_gp55 [Arthrobacter phage Litotes]|uniref:Uncharacterized protein n=3 Tax=Korravirus TaxID=1982076 RepID=A0A3S9UEV6_9CAUD|nr:hypothetical protein FDH63_gp57 [Arthrobacter phage Wayne]YP_010050224.1 hypothetical protein KDJ02_gp55 [Arthrobacter phage Litotes]ALY10782.1 hypothetical protein PBI_WAYNE_58 [Arthrobacter phage Wayne]AZF97692.1 hypothetical protein SEA_CALLIEOMALLEY_56 [Arthrobacter phage CallieOMalley]AZS08776.1 hypothetical protein SEA_LITOTES_55 [Arthrobacter phage Litotes]